MFSAKSKRTWLYIILLNVLLTECLDLTIMLWNNNSSQWNCYWEIDMEFRALMK